jgi:hypothetical protein
MNDLPYTDIREVDDISTVRTYLHNGWLCLEIYKKKVQVFESDEFEERPVYILGNTEGG